MPTNTHVFETKMSKRMQASFIDKPVYKSFVNEEERANLSSGQSVTRPYRSLMRGQSYTRNGSLTFQNITETNETLTINTIKSVPFQVDDFDAAQSNFALQRAWTEDATEQLKSIVDGDLLSEVANATSNIDDSDFGGTSGNPVTLDASNVQEMFFIANRKLRAQNVDITGLDPRMDMKARGAGGAGGLAGFGVLSPHVHEMLERSEQNRETDKGDRVGMNGYVRQKAGFDLMLSNNCYWEAVLGLATNPTNTDTLTIGGVTFTFVSTIGATAGNVLIGGDVDTTRANLATLINAPTSSTANGIALSSTRSNEYTLSDAELIDDLVATNDNSANTLTLTGDGISYLVLTENLTDTTDTWTKEIQHNLIGKKGCVDMVSRVGPDVKVSDIESGFGVKVKPRILYGYKTFHEGANRMVDVKVDSSAWS